MNSSAPTVPPSPDQSLGTALSVVARRIGHRGQSAALVLGLTAAGAVKLLTDGRWIFLGPAIMVAAFGAWGLASTTPDRWPVPPPIGPPDDFRVERVVLRVVAALALVIGLLASIVTAYAWAFAIAGQTIS